MIKSKKNNYSYFINKYRYVEKQDNFYFKIIKKIMLL